MIVPEKKIKGLCLAFVGLGWIGRHRMEALVREGMVRRAVFVDRSRECLEEACRIIPDAQVAPAMEDVDLKEVDGVVIATPSALHSGQSIHALESGCAVFCQKPLARNYSECREVVEAARRNDRLLGVDFSYRFLEGTRMLKEFLDRGDIGRVYAVNAVFHNAYGPDKPWFYDPVLSGGGCVIDLGVHLIDLAFWLLGFPSVENVRSRLYSRGRPFSGEGVEDFGSVQMDFGTGAAMNMACSWNLSAGKDAQIEFTLYGTEGALSLRNVNGSFYDFCLERYRGTQREVLCTPPDAWGGRAAVDWASRLAGGSGAFDEEAEKFCAVSELLDRVYDFCFSSSTSQIERSGLYARPA
ncbi:MAG: Gfo/Idh/MocA family protein [Chitinispirillaceae bacterium]